MTETKRDRAAEWKAFDRDLTRRERQHVPRLQRALTSMVRDVARAVARMDALPHESALALTMDTEPLQMAYEALYGEVFLSYAERAYEGLLPAKALKQPDADTALTWITRLQALLRGEGARRIVGVAESLLSDVVRPWLQESVEMGWGPVRAARELRQRWPALAKARAERIARTELVGAANAGQMAGAESVADALGLPIIKEWIATPDNRTRDTHKYGTGIGGERRPLDQAFSNGLMQPGEPGGAASEVINCRCTVAFNVEGL